MEPVQQQRSKGGRPKKALRRDRQITVVCTYLERVVIQDKAQQAGVTASEYLRTMGLTGKIDSSKTALAKDLLRQKADLSHAAENLNQYVKKLNITGALTLQERFEVHNLVALLKEAALLIKTRLL